MKNRLLSRKLWLAVIGIFAGIMLGAYGVLRNRPDLVEKGIDLAQVSIASYLASEGLADVVERFQGRKAQAAEANMNAVAVQSGLVPPGFSQLPLQPGQPAAADPGARFTPGPS